jgi:flagellar hook-associated protein 2
MATPVGTSSLDVQSLVSQLVSNERASYATRLTSRESKATVQLSALSSLKGALSGFKTSVDTLKTSAAFTPRAAASGDEDVFTVTTAGDAATGSYDITVVALAKAQQIASGPFSDGSATKVGTGKLTITYGDKSFDVDIDDTKNTLSNIRDAINKATGNTGVQATLLNEQNGTRLVLTSAKTGADNEIKIAVSGGDGGLQQLAYSGTDTATMTQMQAAQDAHIKIGAFDHYSDTNTISEAIDGVTISLKATSSDPVSLSVTEDTAALKQRVSNFVQAYNSLYGSMSKLRSYDPNSKAAGPLLGDALLRGIESQIGLDLSNPVAGIEGDYKTLASLGITRQVDGTLKLDDAKLNKALEADRQSVQKVFGSENGISNRLSDHLETMLKDGSALDSRNDALNAELKQIDTDTEALDKRMDVIAKRYTQQFTALDGLLTQLQSTSSYLSSQLASLPGTR